LTSITDETGIIFDIDHFALHDGPGIRTVVYLKGCPLRCVWCHSPESQEKEPQILSIKDTSGSGVVCGREVKASEVVDEIIDNKTFFDASGGGVTLSGGELLYQPEFAQSLLIRLKSSGVHTIAETSGMGRASDLLGIAKYTDIIYYDIKTLNNEKHIEHTGTGNEIILKNLKLLAKTIGSKMITLRVPLIPGYNDTVNEIEEINNLALDLSIREIHLLCYNTSAPAKYQWLEREYIPGVLTMQSSNDLDNLVQIFSKEINITIQ